MTIFREKETKFGIKQDLSEIIGFMGRFKKIWVLYWFYWFYWSGGRPVFNETNVHKPVIDISSVIIVLR